MYPYTPHEIIVNPIKSREISAKSRCWWFKWNPPVPLSLPALETLRWARESANWVPWPSLVKRTVDFSKNCLPRISSKEHGYGKGSKDFRSKHRSSQRNIWVIHQLLDLLISKFQWVIVVGLDPIDLPAILIGGSATFSLHHFEFMDGMNKCVNLR